MLTHLEPQAPQNEKNGNSKKQRKTWVFFRRFWGSAAWGAALLSFGEERRPTARTRPRAPAGSWPDKGLRPLPPTPVLGAALLHLHYSASGDPSGTQDFNT